MSLPDDPRDCPKCGVPIRFYAGVCDEHGKPHDDRGRSVAAPANGPGLLCVGCGRPIRFAQAARSPACPDCTERYFGDAGGGR